MSLNSSMRDGHATRESIVSIVEGSPGIHKRAICHELDLGWGTVSHHVHILVRSGRMKELRGDRLVHYFPAGVPEAHLPWLLALRQGEARQILGHLEERPWRSIASISNELGIARKAVRRHLTNLSESGVVEADGGYHPRFNVPDSQRGLLQRLLSRKAGPLETARN